MTFEEALRDIRSHEFAARVGVASDLTTFLRAASSQESVQTVHREMASDKTSKEGQRRVLCEVLRLSRLQVDFRYQNPRDSALAVLLWALSIVDPALAGLAAEAAIQAPQCWWSQSVANDILQQSMRRDTQATAQSSNASLADFRVNVNAQANTGETALFSRLLPKLARCPEVQVYTYLNVNSHLDRQDEQVSPALLLPRPGYTINLTNYTVGT